jgi:hypothetical protein
VGVVAVLAFGWLLVRAWRGGRIGPALAAVPVAAALLAAGPSARRPRLDREALRRELREAAAERPLWTPTELGERLRTRGLAVTSPQRLAHDLAAFGLSSAVRTVEGRSARRWYDLTPMKKP